MEESQYELALDTSRPEISRTEIQHGHEFSRTSMQGRESSRSSTHGREFPRTSTHSREFSRTSMHSRNSSIRSSCRICLSSIHDPASLVCCGHKFCEGCLEKYWDVKDRPDFIVCPLCRAQAFNVDFMENEALPATEDFRRTFKVLANIPETEENRTSLQCLKVSLLMPAVYYALKWLKIPLTDIFAFLHRRLRRL